MKNVRIPTAAHVVDHIEIKRAQVALDGLRAAEA